MIRRMLLAAALSGALLLPGGASATDTPRTQVRCIVTEGRTACSFYASGPSRFDAARVGPWVVRVWRGTTLVWSYGAQTPDSWTVPSQPGDLVEAAIITGGTMCPPPEGVPAPRCNGAGVIVLSENLLP